MANEETSEQEKQTPPMPGLTGELDPIPTADGVTLALAVSDPDRMAACASRATTLGAAAIVTFLSARSPQGVALSVMPRIERAVMQASEQAHAEAPQLNGPVSLFDLTQLFAGHDAVAVCWEEARSRTKDVSHAVSGSKRPLVIVGPVDGFERSEVDALAQAGAVPVTLGPKVLDVEDAVASAMTLATYAAEQPKCRAVSARPSFDDAPGQA